MKNTVKQIAAGTFIALLLLVGNVKADGTEIKALNNEAIETTLQLENWMINETIWNTNSLNIAEFVVETETSMELEDWMTNAESWSLNNNFVNEAESVLQLEDWMTNDETWNKVYNDTETELRVEDWMINSNFWEQF